MKIELLSHREERGKTVMRVKVRRWFCRDRVHEFVGSSTVWHCLQSFERPGTMMEYALANLYTRLQWEKRAAGNESPQRTEDR